MKTFEVANVRPNPLDVEFCTLLENLVGTGSKKEKIFGRVYPRKDIGLIVDTNHPIEGFGVNAETLFRTRSGNAFVDVMNQAYDRHWPIMLSPDDIWLLIAQGFALHVMNNAEALRSKFVPFEGKKVVEINANYLMRGAADNDWLSVFDQFSNEIQSIIGKDKVDLVVSNFSTTGPHEKAASQIVLMESMTPYLELLGSTLCGFPTITLKGTVEDWRSVRDRATDLEPFDLDWWLQPLLPILDQFVAAAEGRVDCEFWKNFYKLNEDSGGPYITGWISVFFPYVKDWNTEKFTKRNTRMQQWQREDLHGGLTTSSIPSGLSKVPWTWNNFGHLFSYEMIAGFVGGAVREGTVGPAIGWALRESLDPLRFTVDSKGRVQPIDPNTHR